VPVPRGDLAPGKEREALDLPSEGPPEPAAEQPVSVEPGAEPALRARALFEALARRARPAGAEAEIAELLALGAGAHPAARLALGGTHATSVLAAGRVLLAGGAPEREAVAARLSRTLAAEAAVPLLEELLLADPKLATPAWLAGLLELPEAGTRAAAARAFEARLSPEMLPALQPRFDSSRIATRSAALELVARLDDPLALNLLLSRLGDTNAQLAARAASVLAARDPAEPQLLLLAFPAETAAAGWERSRAYALLALAEREESRGLALFTLEHVPALLEGLADRRALVAGTAAVALARLGFRASAGQCGAWLEREVPHQLVRCGTGVEFHADFSALARPALRALALLSGIALGEDGEAWRRWWIDNASGFRARHALLDLPDDAAARLRVDGSDAHGPWTLLAHGRADEAARGDVLYLDAAAAELLFVFLREQGTFDARHPPSVATPAQTGVVRIAVGDAEKRFTAQAEGEWFRHLMAEFQRVRAEQAWQRHAPADRPRLAFWRAENEHWSQLTAEERPREIKRFVLAALRRSPALAERELGLAELERLFAEPGVAERADLEPLLAVLAAEEAFDARVERTLALVRLAADATGGDPATEADPLGRIVTLALERFGAAVVPALRSLAHALPESTLVGLGRDARPEARALAAEALVEGDGPEADVLALLLDPAPLVVATALAALGAHPRETARARLFALTRTGPSELRPAALRALVPLGGKDVLDLAQECLGENDEQLSRAAAWALAELADPRCATLLGALLLRGTASPLYAEARRGLLRLGEVGVLECMRLSRATGARAQREGALLLAEFGRAEAAPVLLSLLAQDPRDGRVVFELSVLAGQDFQPEQHPETAALEWWDLVVHDDALAWFLAGAERAGLRAPPRPDFDGGPTLAVASFLLEAAALEEAHLAERALRELERMLGQPLPRPSAAEREAALEALRAEIERRFAR
jgi:hypothetical protein